MTLSVYLGSSPTEIVMSFTIPSFINFGPDDYSADQYQECLVQSE